MAKVQKDEVNKEKGEAPISKLPFYCFFPVHGESCPNEECLNPTTPSSTPNAYFHCSEICDRQHEGGTGFDLNESFNDGNTSDVKVLKPSQMNCYGQIFFFYVGQEIGCKRGKEEGKNHKSKSIYWCILIGGFAPTNLFR